MEILRNGVQWQKWVSFLLLACAVFAYRKIDIPGYTREFISKIDHDCRDFKGVMNKCHVWKDLGFCFKYRREMQHVCNRTCQYCVPGQKQWKVIDRAWGRVKEPVSQSVSAHALTPAVQHKGLAIQILGKERPPQVDDAASAIATQLEKGVDHDVSASPNVFGRLPEHHTAFQNTLAPTYNNNATENDETKGKLLTSQPVSELDHEQGAQTITNQASISGKTQMNPPLRKPALSGLKDNQVTVTVNQKPGTGEAIFKVQTSPHASGIRYTTEETPGGFPSPNYILENENEEDRTKSEEEETKIREATQAIKNVMKLFDNGNRHGHTKLVSQAAQDFTAHSKSLETNRELAGIQSEIDAQAQSQDLAAARAQALSQQIGKELSPGGLGTRVSSIPNYAVISTKDSKDWKNLAHMLATQLKSVLNHMEDREKENQYQKGKMEEQMMMMARQRQMMEGDNDEDPYDDEDDDADDGEMGDREKRRHSVLSPHLKKSSENKSKNISLKDKSLRRIKSGNITEQKLLHRAVKKLSRLEMLQKSQGKLMVQE